MEKILLLKMLQMKRFLIILMKNISKGLTNQFLVTCDGVRYLTENCTSKEKFFHSYLKYEQSVHTHMCAKINTHEN